METVAASNSPDWPALPIKAATADAKYLPLAHSQGIDLLAGDLDRMHTQTYIMRTHTHTLTLHHATVWGWAHKSDWPKLEQCKGYMKVKHNTVSDTEAQMAA